MKSTFIIILLALTVVVLSVALPVWAVRDMVSNWAEMGWVTRVSWLLYLPAVVLLAYVTTRGWNRAMNDRRRTWERDDWKGGQAK